MDKALPLCAGSFHRVFSKIFGFPASYGNNMNTLIDCLSFPDEPSAETTRVHVRLANTFAIQLDAAKSFRMRDLDQFERCETLALL
jgi:hypothetical protein